MKATERRRAKKALRFKTYRCPGCGTKPGWTLVGDEAVCPYCARRLPVKRVLAEGR